MKILIVTQYFYPENFRINDLAIELKKRGHEVTIFTGKPNYPQGEYYEEYSFKKDDDEIWEGIKIYRCPLRARKTGNINLIKNYLSFVYWGKKYIKKLYKNEYDCIYVFEVSPITVALPAIKLKKRLKIPIILNVQDLWPDSVVAVTGMKNIFFIGLLNKLVKYVYNNCDLVLCASPSFVKKIQECGIRSDKVKYWPQYSIVEKSNGCKNNIFNKSKFNITFTGNIGEAQAIDIAINTAYNLKDTKIHWNFFGEGRKKLAMEQLVSKLHLEDNITFHGQVKEIQIPEYLAESDAALLILKPEPVFDMTIPAKLQTYLACGIPILGCIGGESKRIIDEANCGITTDTISIEELTRISSLISNLEKEELATYKENALIYNKENFCKNKLLNKLEYYMEELKNEYI